MNAFFKYQGTGNDFILLDDRKGDFSLSQEAIEKMCHRRYGIGSDGLILLQAANGFDFRMVYFNADGREGSMCGNGGRCIVRFAHDLGIFSKSTKFIAIDGPHQAAIGEGIINLKMSDTKAMEIKGDLHFYDTGSPHVIEYVKDLEDFPVLERGRAIRNSPFWKQKNGTNVNFVEVLSPNKIRVRTYERGVEDETYSCGTGVTACALDRFVSAACQSPIQIITNGGTLEVTFEVNEKQEFYNINLIGPAERVFVGELSV